MSQNKTKIYTEFQDLHFIQIKGPNSKGHAEMALHVSEPVSDDNEVITLNSLEDLIEDNSNENGHIPGPGIGTSSEAPNHSSNSQSLKHLENEQTEFISTTGNTGKDSVEINLSENQISSHGNIRVLFRFHDNPIKTGYELIRKFPSVCTL